jgi:hypothetical protein
MIDSRRVFAGVRMRTLVAAVALTAPLAALGGASPALASSHHPTGEWAPYADCPLSTPGVAACVLAETTSGEFTVGKRTVPINKTITLQGGIKFNEKEEEEFVGTESGDGETLSKTALYVPGGLLDIVAPEKLNKEQKEKFEKIVNEGITGVTETTELAAPASDIGIDTENLIGETGTALSLPAKIKLGNVFLGNECYVGSNSAPIELPFTTGTTSPPAPNKPIKGAAGTLTFSGEFTIITLSGGKLVNNSFAAPEAKGCGGAFSSIVDPAVDAELGLPSAAGHNTAILEGKLSTASAEAVTASE